MKVEVFTIAWNEERYIKQFIDYYNWADKITVYDNCSTDNTARIAKDSGCIVIPYGKDEQDNKVMLEVKANCWKDSKADWVIVCDVDEWLYHKDGMRKTLEFINTTEATIIETVGYSMISEEYKPLKEVDTGFYDATGNSNKCVCFRPDRIDDMGWSIGCHRCEPIGDVKAITYPGIMLLHYHLIGRKEVKERFNDYASRMSKSDLKNKYGLHYTMDDEQKDSLFNILMKQAKRIL